MKRTLKEFLALEDGKEWAVSTTPTEIDYQAQDLRELILSISGR